MAQRVKPFSSLMANDLMTRTVVLVPQEMSLRGAARLLSRSRVSGAPVVDAEGHCVGVLSTTDFMHFVEDGRNPKATSPAALDNVYAAWQVVGLETVPLNKVRDYMTSQLVTARASTRVVEMAKQMVKAHVHRVVIVDEHQRPIGIVSSTDILAAVAARENGQALAEELLEPAETSTASVT